MKFKFLFLFLIISNISIAQPEAGIKLEVSKEILATLINGYEAHCNEMVADTITQTGTINYKTIPVKDKNGNILHYALGQADTIWHQPDCPEYKDNGLLWDYYSPPNRFSFSSDISLIEGTNVGAITGTTKQHKTTVKIEREYICGVKRRRVEPFSDRFWDWIKTK